jgi:hypothetical protein
MEPTRDPNGTYSIERVEPTTFALFVVVILSVVRFYHGNIRQLDTTYTDETGKAGAGDGLLFGGRKVGPRWQVALDFLVIVTEALGLAILSFLITTGKEFAIGYGILLLIDALWFWGVHDQRGASIQGKGWMLNNLMIGVVILLLVLSWKEDLTDTRLYVLCGAMLLNTFIDVILTRHLYFPDPTEKVRTDKEVA